MKKQTRREFIGNVAKGSLFALSALNLNKKIFAADSYNPMNILPKSAPVGKWKFGAISDIHTSANPHTEYVAKINILQSSMKQSNLQLVLNCGDTINWTESPDIEEWAKFEELWATSRSQIAHFMTPGNHCIRRSGYTPSSVNFDRYLEKSGFPGQTKEKMDYYFDYGNVRFICINASQYIYRNGQYIWSDPIDDNRMTELQNYLNGLFNDAIGKIDHIVFFQHVGVYAPMSRYAEKARTKFQIIYNYLDNKYPNKKYFTVTHLHGHSHIFYRTFRHNTYFIEIPSSGANGTYKYKNFLANYNNNDRTSLDLIDGDVWGEGEQCYYEVEVDGKSIEFKLVAFNSYASDYPNPHYPSEYQNVGITYPQGTIISSVKLTTGEEASIDKTTNKVKANISNYPNPFNPECYIAIESFSSQLSAVSKIKIYNILGQVVRELNVNNGSNSVYWDGRDNFGKELSSGMYFYEMLANNKVQNCRKMLMLK